MPGTAGFAGRWGGAPAGGLPAVAAMGWGVLAGVVPGAGLLATEEAVGRPGEGAFPDALGFSAPADSFPALSPLNA